MVRERKGTEPKSDEIKELLREWRDLVPGDADVRSGVNEALIRTFYLFQPADNFLPEMGIFDIASQIQLNKESQFIYVFLQAVRRFMLVHNGSLPQVVRLPDINTSTKDYL